MGITEQNLDQWEFLPNPTLYMSNVSIMAYQQLILSELTTAIFLPSTKSIFSTSLAMCLGFDN